ncbi:Uncharacterised protein [Citrobacter koseri]|uniref:Uncharacterized protein n=1 Tax=Citrobacter koseri TaxID=545 RepID=A0A2X2WEJ5_CITKO|nr:Uncharacterised protein [Citrobacter koseri]
MNSVLGRNEVGRKWRDSGKIFQNINADASAKQPIAASAMRQLKKVGKYAADQTPAHAANRVAANVQPH